MFSNQKYVVSNICRKEVETGGSPVLCLYFASLFRFQFCDPSLLFPFKYVFTSSLPIPTYLGAYLILSFRSLCPFACFLCTLSLRPWGQSSLRVARIPPFFCLQSSENSSYVPILLFPVK